MRREFETFSYVKIFKDKDVLKEMLRMRAEGFSYPYLANHFKCHYSSVIHQCQKNGVLANKEKIITKCGRVWKKHNENYKRPEYERKKVMIKKEPVKIEPPIKVIRRPAEILNAGKSYAEYLRESESRKFIRDEKGSIIKIIPTPL